MPGKDREGGGSDSRRTRSSPRRLLLAMVLAALVSALMSGTAVADGWPHSPDPPGHHSGH
jgi:hypothetical protein